MSTNLENYLKKQRSDLDVESPDDLMIWEGIRKDLQTEEIRLDRKRVWIRLRNIAAVAIIVLSLGYVFIDIIGDRGIGRQIGLATIDKGLGEREKDYRTLVSLKQEEVGSYNQVDNVIIAELLEEIQKLDTIYQETLKDLSELGYNEQVINTIFDTYEKKIYLLELIILENNKIRNHDTNENVFL